MENAIYQIMANQGTAEQAHFSFILASDRLSRQLIEAPNPKLPTPK